MNKDIEILDGKYKFKYRVSGLLLKNRKLLVVKINNNNFYCLPGGHVELMEDSKEAIVREFKEETGIDTNVKQLVFVVENFFQSMNKDCHELGMYYLLESKEDLKTNDYTVIENDNGNIFNLHFKWIDVKNIDLLKPEFLKDKIANITENVQHLIVKNDKII